jgi:uncharacterized membrane protein
MMYRMTIAVLALVNCLVATYLHLWKTGRVGTLVCTASGGCETAQFSRYGWFLGVDVALIGAVGYAVLLLVALVSIQPRHLDARRMSVALLALIVPAFLFTLRLKYGEWVVLQVFCPWCLISAVSITTCLVLAWLDWRRTAPVIPPTDESARMPLAA